MGVTATCRAGFTPLTAAAVIALGSAGCGGNDGPSTRRAPAEGKRGGTLIALWAGDVDSIDPGITYSQLGTQLVRATQKTLYRPDIDDATDIEPDLAATDPQISADGCHVTATLKPGVRFSPPANREVTSADVKYAIERGFFNSVNSGYAASTSAACAARRWALSRAPGSPGSRRPTRTRSCSSWSAAAGRAAARAASSRAR